MDPFTLSVLGGAALGGIGAIGNYYGQKSANVANAKMAREQMDFQERMSNTSWQRAKADMIKAGINPLLAVSQGGASTPTGAMGNAQNTLSGLSDSIPKGIASALAIQQMKAQLGKIQSDTELNNAMRENAKAQTQLNSNSALKVAVDTHNAKALGTGLDNEAAVNKSWLGRATAYLDRFTNSASSLVDVFRGGFPLKKGKPEYSWQHI